MWRYCYSVCNFVVGFRLLTERRLWIFDIRHSLICSLYIKLGLCSIFFSFSESPHWWFWILHWLTCADARSEIWVGVFWGPGNFRVYFWFYLVFLLPSRGLSWKWMPLLEQTITSFSSSFLNSWCNWKNVFFHLVLCYLWLLPVYWITSSLN